MPSPKIPKYCSLCKKEVKIYKIPTPAYINGFAHLCIECLSAIEKYLNYGEKENG